jgi:DNA gyrase/topoisomerase IV subunit B
MALGFRWSMPSPTDWSRKFTQTAKFTTDFEQGRKTSELTVIGHTDKQGTKIHFLPDHTIFNTIEFTYDILSRRFASWPF